jgi:hypothetical protein
MYFGEGTLTLLNGKVIELTYYFANKRAEARDGYLVCDARQIENPDFCNGLTVTCSDGTSILVAVTHQTDRYLAVTGRVLKAEEQAWD